MSSSRARFSDAPSLGRADLLAIVTLLATAGVIGMPILEGAHLTYVDNPVHIAEILELARGEGKGWSELSFTGFSLKTLHSPLFYPLVAALVRAGAPVSSLYMALLLAGFVAPALSVFFVARRRHLGPLLSGLLAYLVLVQAPAITGIGSALGGMWTHAFGAAAVVLLADVASHPHLSLRQTFALAVLLTFIGLTHFFALLAAVLVLLLAIVIHREGLSRAEWKKRALAAGIGAAASAKYWLSFLLTTRAGDAPSDSLPPLSLAARLLLPTDVIHLLNGDLSGAIRGDVYWVDAVPMVALVLAGLAGAFGKHGQRDPLTRLSASLAGVVLFLLLVHHYVAIPVLGPVSWRLLSWVRVGFALSAIAWLKHVEERKGPVPKAAALGIALPAIALGLCWGRPLRNDQPESLTVELRDIRALGEWLERQGYPVWGRVYVEDTFGQNWYEAGMSHSHLPVLASSGTGFRQLGTFYGVVPYRTRWTLSEFRTLYGRRGLSEEGLLEVVQKTMTSVLVTSNAATEKFVRGTSLFEPVHVIGRYTVFRRQGEPDGWIAPLRPSNVVEDVKAETGDIRFNLETRFPRARVLVRTSFHPWWRVAGPPGAKVIESPEGFLVVDRIPAGRFSVRVWFEPSRVPDAVSGLGVFLLILFGGALSPLGRKLPFVRGLVSGGKRQSQASLQ